MADLIQEEEAFEQRRPLSNTIISEKVSKNLKTKGRCHLFFVLLNTFFFILKVATVIIIPGLIWVGVSKEALTLEYAKDIFWETYANLGEYLTSVLST